MSSDEELKYASTVEQIRDYLLEKQEETDDDLHQLESLVNVHDDVILRLEANDQEHAALIRSLIKRLETRMDRIEEKIAKLGND